MRDDRERSAVIANKLAPFEDLSQEAGFYAGEIGLHRYDFNRPRADVDILKQVRAPARSGPIAPNRLAADAAAVRSRLTSPRAAPCCMGCGWARLTGRGGGGRAGLDWACQALPVDTTARLVVLRWNSSY